MCGKCDYCVWRATGVMPPKREAWGFMVNTDCRMRANGIAFITISTVETTGFQPVCF